MSEFRDTPESALRRLVRLVIRKSPLTKSEQAVTLAVVNLWFHHRNGPKGYIHPGRERLAKSARVSVRTVASTLARLRDGGALVVVGRPKGEGQKPTEYRIDVSALLVICGTDLPTVMSGRLVPMGRKSGGQNCTPLKSEIAHHMGAGIAHSLKDVAPAFSRLRVVGGSNA